MALRRYKHNIYPKLQTDLLQPISEYAWSLRLGKLNFAHNESYFTHVLPPHVYSVNSWFMHCSSVVAVSFH
ncbi:hypothetical protein D3C76_1741970 [compost metagenome]